MTFPERYDAEQSAPPHCPPLATVHAIVVHTKIIFRQSVFLRRPSTETHVTVGRNRFLFFFRNCLTRYGVHGTRASYTRM